MQAALVVELCHLCTLLVSHEQVVCIDLSVLYKMY